MKIIESFKKPTAPYYDDAGPFELTITNDSGKSINISANEGEPEDFSFGRDLSFVFSIKAMLKMAYEAGKNGESIEIEEKEIEI